jgi:hypothetical protein
MLKYNWLKSLFKKKDPEVNHLRNYIIKSCTGNLTTCRELLSSEEALKQFGKLWGDYKADMMMMLTSIEYEFIANYDFTESELKVLRHFIGNTGTFFKRCKEEHDSIVKAQQDH